MSYRASIKLTDMISRINIKMHPNTKGFKNTVCEIELLSVFKILVIVIGLIKITKRALEMRAWENSVENYRV